MSTYTTNTDYTGQITKNDLKGTTQYQQLVDAASQAGITTSIENAWNPTNRNTTGGMMNEYLPQLANQATNLYIRDASYQSQFNVFKKGFFPELANGGTTVVEVAADYQKVRSFNSFTEKLFRNDPPRVYAFYHPTNFKINSTFSISASELVGAFDSVDKMDQTIGMITAKQVENFEREFTIAVMGLIEEIYSKDLLFNINLPVKDSSNLTAEEYKDAAIKIRTIVKKWQILPTGRYNLSGIPTTTPEERIVILTSPEFIASKDVNVLADAFNESRADLEQRVVLVPELPKGCHAIICDSDALFIGDVMNRSVISPFNPEGLSYAITMHKWSSISWSFLSNAVALSEKPDTKVGEITVKLEGIKATVNRNGEVVNNISISDADKTEVVVEPTGTITPGETPFIIVPEAYTAEVAVSRGTGETSKAVKTSAMTYLDRYGYLHIGKEVKAGDKLTITVSSTYVDPETHTKPELTAEVSVDVVA